MVLFEHSEKRLADVFRFEAEIHGAKIKNDPVVQPKAEPRKGFVFGDPEEYKDMSMEKREVLTREMMNQHKIWAQESIQRGSKGK